MRASRSEAKENHRVLVPIEGHKLPGRLCLPRNAHGLVVFVPGRTGGGRGCPRARVVAERLQKRGYGTLLIDLLTGEEKWIGDTPDFSECLFGKNT